MRLLYARSLRVTPTAKIDFESIFEFIRLLNENAPRSFRVTAELLSETLHRSVSALQLYLALHVLELSYVNIQSSLQPEFAAHIAVRVLSELFRTLKKPLKEYRKHGGDGCCSSANGNARSTLELSARIPIVERELHIALARKALAFLQTTGTQYMHSQPPLSKFREKFLEMVQKGMRFPPPLPISTTSTSMPTSQTAPHPTTATAAAPQAPPHHHHQQHHHHAERVRARAERVGARPANPFRPPNPFDEPLPPAHPLGSSSPAMVRRLPPATRNELCQDPFVGWLYRSSNGSNGSNNRRSLTSATRPVMPTCLPSELIDN